MHADRHVTSIHCGFESCRFKPFVLKVKANDKTTTVSMAQHIRKKHNTFQHSVKKLTEAIMSTTSNGNDLAAFDRVIIGLPRAKK